MIGLALYVNCKNWKKIFESLSKKSNQSLNGQIYYAKIDGVMIETLRS